MPRFPQVIFPLCFAAKHPAKPHYTANTGYLWHNICCADAPNSAARNTFWHNIFQSKWKREIMFLFKTSGATFDSVIKNQKHAFAVLPKDWQPGELILVSKNKVDCKANEKQISHTMELQECVSCNRAKQINIGPEQKDDGNIWRYAQTCNQLLILLT